MSLPNGNAEPLDQPQMPFYAPLLLYCRLSDEEYSDDEDVSWKVRRAAAKCLQAIIESYPDLLKDIYSKAASALIGRFKEREENVKSDIFQTFVELVKQIGATAERFEGAAGEKPIDSLRFGCL